MTYMTTPIGRIVQGDLWTGQTTGYGGKPLTDRNGLPKVEFFIGLAVPKGPEFDAFWQQVQQQAAVDWPQGQSQQGGFAWKVKDGDAADQISKAGRAGHWILSLVSGFPPVVYDQSYNQMTDPMLITRGDYVRVNISVKGNGDASKPGIFLNRGMTLFIQKGEPIVSGPSPQEVFGAPAPAAQPVQPVAPVAAQPLPVAPVIAAPVAAQPLPVAPAPLAAPLPAAPLAAPLPVAPGAPATPPPVAPAPLAAPAPMPGAPMPGAPMPGAPMPGAPLAPVPGAPLAPVPGAPMPGAPLAPVPGAPLATAVPGAAQPAPGFLTPGQPQ